MAELQLQPERPKYNKTNGRFLKGNEPHNKGKKWDDYMTEEGKKKSAKGWENLKKHRRNGNPEWAERKKKQCLSFTDEGKFIVHSCIEAANKWLERRTGERCCPENIARCCRENHSQRVSKHDWSKGRPKGSGFVNTDHKYKGIRFYYETDFNIWKNKIKS